MTATPFEGAPMRNDGFHMVRLLHHGGSRTRERDAAASSAHPLLTQVAIQARQATSAGAVAISRGEPAWAAREVLAAAGDLALLDELDVPEREAFADGAPVITRNAATCLLAVGVGSSGTLTILRPKLRRGAALRDCLGHLTELACEALRAAEAERRLAETMEASVGSLASLLDLRDGYTGQHSTSVVARCAQVARRMGVTGDELEHLRIAAHLHDLGKIGVPDEILHKPGPLDATEWSIMREHPVWGARALESVPGFRAAARAVRGHHERWDGGGYPDGLAGEAIPVAARIIAACDAYEAMTSTRPYRPALAVTEARERLVSGTGSQFDPAAVWGLLDVLAG
jgi:HD-GYP domain-containing protein (c-di-GMP phosphodiesterase class II)